MYRSLVLVVVVLLILTVPKQSDASLVELYRNLAEVHNPQDQTIQVSPSPSPVSSLNPSSAGAAPNNTAGGKPGDSEVHTNSPKLEQSDDLTDERCQAASTWCHHENITACVDRSGNGPQDFFLLVQNGGENSLKVNVTLLPVHTIYKEIELLKNQAKKINISVDIGGIKSVVLSAGQGECVIHMRSPAPENNFYKQFSSYAIYLTPINGAYLLFITAMIIGGTWACCRFGKGRNHPEGVPYQELEMGQTEESVSARNVETAEGWDQGWDDDWDEEKAVKSPGHSPLGNGKANGHASRSSNTEGWDNDWDD